MCSGHVGLLGYLGPPPCCVTQSGKQAVRHRVPPQQCQTAGVSDFWRKRTQDRTHFEH